MIECLPVPFVRPADSRESGPPVVALKITHLKYAATAFEEIRVHRALEKAGLGGSQLFSELVETFPQGNQICLAFRLHGRDLSHAIPKEGLGVNHVRFITRQILRALASLHGAGFMHTDIKPANILYDPSTRTARLADLGLACQSLNLGEDVATCDYTPPEAIVGTPMSAAIDMWSLGCTIFEMLTGSLLFDPWSACEDKYEEFKKTQNGSHSPVNAILPKISNRRSLQKPCRGVVMGGKYRLETKLGEGKFGDVWSASVLNNRPIPKPSAREFARRKLSDHRFRSKKVKRSRWDLYDVSIAYEHLLQMQQLLGPMPHSMTLGKWQRLFFATDGKLRFDETVAAIPLEQRLASTLPAEQASAAAEFLAQVLRFDPALRATPSQLLASNWLIEK